MRPHEDQVRALAFRQVQHWEHTGETTAWVLRPTPTAKVSAKAMEQPAQPDQQPHTADDAGYPSASGHGAGT